MRILIISATKTENQLIYGSEIKIGEPLSIKEPFNHSIDVMVTGIGAVPTAFALTKYAEQYELVINIGIAGSFKPNFPIGEVVCIKEDVFGDYGVDDRGTFRSLSEMKLKVGEKSFQDEILINPWLNNEFKYLNTPLVKGVTLSTASGSMDIIDKINKRWNADVETMESASVFYVCRELGVKFICFRAISNMVEPRDKSKWEIARAINNLDVELKDFIRNLPIQF